jgi:predicted RNA-binding Zn-ribbon protein involved in translation (DUF1610 family)
MRCTVTQPSVNPAHPAAYGIHSVSRVYEECEKLHCPACGRRSVWGDDSDDYYHGRNYVCIDCGANGSGWDAEPAKEVSPIVAELRRLSGWGLKP